MISVIRGKKVCQTKITKVFLMVVCLIFLFGLLAGCSNQEVGGEDIESPNVSKIAITDMAGRTVEIPSKIDKVYGTDPVASILLYTIDPDKLLGWNYDLNDQEKEFILSEYHNLTAFGMGDGVNLEAIIQAAPQICLQAGPIGSAEITKAENLQQQLGIPVVMVDGDLDKAVETYNLLGEILKMESQVKELTDYTRKLLNLADKLDSEAAQITSVYFGNGAQSLETAPPESAAAAVLTLIKADNVAKTKAPTGGRIQVTLEQLLTWDPDMIFVNGEPKQNLSGPQAARAILEDSNFSTLKAVKSGNVYGIPKAPFAWMGRPMGINQLIGVAWAGNILYPEHFNYDMNEEVKEFFSIFYHMELKDDQIQALFTK